MNTVLSPEDPMLNPLRLGRQTFPGVWTAMMPPELMDLRFPDERKADCHNCPKACYDGWRADYRCCTYHPRISNFLLGLALQTPTGAAAVDDLLERGMLLPEGMHSAPRQWLDFLDDQHHDTFGKSQKVLCPMLDEKNGLCRAHAFRNAVCSTYFCYQDQGSAGSQFWSQIQTLGTQLEMRLSQWALQKAGFDVAAYMKMMNELAPEIGTVSTAGGWQPAVLQKLWGPFWGQEKVLLQRCADLIIEHRDELWTIAQAQVIAEAGLFDKALVQLVPAEQRETLDDDGDDWEPVDLDDLWEDCLIAHDALWNPPEGLFRLSPLVKFVPNQRQTAEEVYYQDQDQFIEYRFANGVLNFRQALSTADKMRLESFAAQPQPIPEEDEFLAEMVHRKVLWSV